MRVAFGSKFIKIEVFDDKGKALVVSEKGFSVPSDFTSEDAIVKIKGKDLPELDRNTVVSLVMTTKSSDRIKYPGVVAVSMDRQLNIKLVRTGDTELLKERRRSFKIKVNEPGKALFFVRDDNTIRFEEPIEVNIKDINIGGVFVSAEGFEFIEGDLVCFDFMLDGKSTLNVAAYVLRVQRAADGTIAGYGCEFQGLTGAQEDIIGRYILKIQSKLRAQESEKDNWR